jgi:hypothetical protein
VTTVVVLGAGASRGAGEYADRPDRVPLSCLPPLNADFFTHLQRITHPKHQPTVQAVIDDVIAVFGPNFSLTLEDYFTQLEFLLNAVDIASTQPQRERKNLVQKRNHLMSALSAVLESSTNQIIQSTGGCDLHQKLVKHLTPRDSIISFNYDCLIDDALRRAGQRKWDARLGYAFPADVRIENADIWMGKKRRPLPDRTIKLFKLHGSLNWQLPARLPSPVRLKQRLHQQNGTPRFSIIPPVSNKAFASDTQGTIYKHIWQEAAKSLRRADVIAICGFAFGATDVFSQSLFRIAVQNTRRLRLLVIATPSRETRQRIRNIFDVALAGSPAPLVRQYRSFEDFMNHVPYALISDPI